MFGFVIDEPELQGESLLRRQKNASKATVPSIHPAADGFRAVPGTVPPGAPSHLGTVPPEEGPCRSPLRG